MKGHTEHQCFPWSKQELAKSAIRALQQRCQMRINHAAEQEISIREYMAEVEAFFLAKLQERLRDLNEKDRARIASLVEAAALDKTYLTSTPTTPGPPNRPLARNLDARIERNLDEITVAFSGTDAVDGFNLARTPPTRPRGFAAVLPEMPVEEFARLLEAKLQTHFLADGNEDYLSSKSGASSRAELSGPAPNLSIYTPKPVDSSTPKSTHIRPYPIEPQVQVINGTHRRGASVSENSMFNGPVVYRNSLDQSLPPPGVPKLDLSAPSAAGDAQNQPAPPSRISRSISEMQPHQRRQSRTHSVDRKVPDNGYKYSISNSEKTSPMTPQDDNISTGGRSVDSRASRIALTGYNFGEEYLTKPLDVCVLPDDRLAISDSCGGIYITDREGEVINRLLIEEASASSLSYNEIRKELFVSLMLQERRTIHIYLGTPEEFTLTEIVPCPKDPEIDITRTRLVEFLLVFVYL